MNYPGAEPRGIIAAKADMFHPYLRLVTPRQSLGEFFRLNRTLRDQTKGMEPS